jgi:hypothetical protein
MDHKDLLNSVISNMANSQETTTEVPTDDYDSSAYIQLSLCTGETFLVDPNKLDWDNAISQIAHLQDNMVALRNIQYGLLQAAGNDDEDTQKFVQSIITQLTDILKGFQISVDYRVHNPNLTDRDIAMLMAFDVNNVTATMFHHLSIYSALSMLAPTHEIPSDILGESEPSELKTYRVIGIIDNDKAQIVSCEETDDYKPDTMGIVEQIGDNKYSYITSAYDAASAKRQAESAFGIKRAFTVPIDDHDVSGLVSE